MTAFISAALTGLQLGVLAGILLGPIRLAGVDYGVWFRNPAEIAERRDRTWIGLTKLLALRSSLLLVLCPVIYLLMAGPFPFLSRWPLDLFWGLLGLSIQSAIAFAVDNFGFLIGLIFGVVLLQATLDVLWRRGLVWGTGTQLEIRLSRPPDAPTTTVRAPNAAPILRRRRLIICCDGTWNSPDQKRETNVVQLLRAINPLASDGSTQISYYHLGVGTGNVLDRFFGGGAGIGLSSSVKACYGFLVDNYRDGDQILLFGFSRGAYVVRSVAGMVGLVGVLQRREMVRFNDVWNYYTLPQRLRIRGQLDILAPQRRTNVEISCVGVWDTVGALGIPGSRVCASSYGFHETSLGEHVHHAFQALAIDERRGNFQPAVWVKTRPEQVLEQVWFPGVHSNVGGGYVEHGLSDATLLWMLSRLSCYELLDFDMNAITDAVQRHYAEAPPTGKLQNSRSLFWKMIACPIPRPVGITDDSERIHGSAFDRRAVAVAGDLYAGRRRIDWLETIPSLRVCPSSPFERDHLFADTGTGVAVPPIVRANHSVCDRLVRRIFG